MFELLHNKADIKTSPGPILNPACTEPPPIPELVPGPMIITILAGSNSRLILGNFVGTITDHTGTVKTYTTPTMITEWNAPNDGNGFCHLYVRGLIHNFKRTGYTVTGMINVAQWGTECVIGGYHGFFAITGQFPCARITATDAPWFGTHPHGVYGTNMEDFFNRAGDVYSNLDHWNTTQVTSMMTIFYGGQYLGGDTKRVGGADIPSTWDTSSLDATTKMDLNGSQDMTLSEFHSVQPQHVKDRWGITL